MSPSFLSLSFLHVNQSATHRTDHSSPTAFNPSRFMMPKIKSETPARTTKGGGTMTATCSPCTMEVTIALPRANLQLMEAKIQNAKKPLVLKEEALARTLTARTAAKQPSLNSTMEK
jgi:hypothetical protein